MDENEFFDILGGEVPPPRDGCVCGHTVCPGGELCFDKVRKLKGRKLTLAICELIDLGVCVCSTCGFGLTSMPKRRREKTPRCACGMYFSNEEVRGLGLFSRHEWRSQGFKPQTGEMPVASVWRTVYWAGITGGRIDKVGLYAKEQVQPIRRRLPR